jgi:enoyl-CoA hydratase/carnithine racemase
MQITAQHIDGERVLSIIIDDLELGGELVGALHSALEAEARGEEGAVVIRFEGRPHAVVGEFPAMTPGPGREDMRFFAQWEDLIAGLARLRAKTFVGYQGTVGAAAVQLGLVVDLRLAAAGARLRVGSLVPGRFPGTTVFWLAKFCGLGEARRLLLLDGMLESVEAVRLGLLDVVAPELDLAVEEVLRQLRPLTAEAACFLRRILDESYRNERVSALEQIKAARFRVGTTPAGS